METTTTRSSPALARERAITWRYAEYARVCDVLEAHEFGTLVRCTRLPTFWNYNSLRVEGPDRGVAADALVHAADVLQGDLAHRQIEVEDEAAGARLRPRFQALGWATERLAWLRLEGAPPAGPLEGTFDHGEEGYGLWLDPAVADDPTYAEHWAGHRPVTVTIEEDQIVIRRAGEDDDDSD